MFLLFSNPNIHTLASNQQIGTRFQNISVLFCWVEPERSFFWVR